MRDTTVARRSRVLRMVLIFLIILYVIRVRIVIPPALILPAISLLGKEKARIWIRAFRMLPALPQRSQGYGYSSALRYGPPPPEAKTGRA
jgi:hypothetical protein